MYAIIYSLKVYNSLKILTLGILTFKNVILKDVMSYIILSFG